VTAPAKKLPFRTAVLPKPHGKTAMPAQPYGSCLSAFGSNRAALWRKGSSCDSFQYRALIVQNP